jgi:hypothetical protein
MIQFVRVPGWGFSFDGKDAWYYGRRWSLHIGPWLIFIWQLTDEQIEAADRADQMRRKRSPR